MGAGRFRIGNMAQVGATIQHPLKGEGITRMAAAVWPQTACDILTPIGV
jgi:hypothetical protein